MSLYDYKASKSEAFIDAPFYALIMAAMRRADTPNSRALQKAFPFVWAELQTRYNAPGGRLPSDGPEPSA